MLSRIGANNLPLKLEDLLAFERVAHCSVEEGPLNAIISGFLPRDDCLRKLRVLVPPSVER